MRSGLIAEELGDVRFNNFKVVDNLKANMEITSAGAFWEDDRTQINGALNIGASRGNSDGTGAAKGIVTPRTEFFVVKNVRFHNFEGGSYALGSCSHCEHGAATDSGARTVTFEGLEFYNVPIRIGYNAPRKAIYFDRDGSLTGQGPNSFATPYEKHHEQPECKFSSEIRKMFDGVVCDNRVQIRRVAFTAPAPGDFSGMPMYFLRYDDDLVGDMSNETLQEYVDNKSNYGRVPYKLKSGPSGWATPFITGHKYKMHWGMIGLDFTGM